MQRDWDGIQPSPLGVFSHRPKFLTAIEVPRHKNVHKMLDLVTIREETYADFRPMLHSNQNFEVKL